MEKRRSFIESSGTLSRSSSRQSMSTRMKKVAPPPPPTVAVGKPQPLSNGSVHPRRTSSGSGDQQQSRPPLATTPGEDCAIDELLEGRMEIEVVLPDLKRVRMTVDRRTPMMDLLVQATTSNKISPSGHIINVISKDERNVNYKPNTPIGSLDANTVYIIPKSTLELPVKRMPKLANQPFEQTFRLQVNLPQNQRMVLRVSPRITLAELKSQICSEKELDLNNHHLVHPAQPDTVLDLNATLDVYGCAEISLMSNSGLRDSIRSTNLFGYPRIEEERRRTGIFRLFSRKRRDFPIETPTNGIRNSISSESDLNKNSYQPKQSIKRKPPAPAPPPLRNSSPPLITQSSNSINSRPESEISVKTADEVESSVSHSRHSSDSSGYHEPSVFSDCSENKSPEASIVHGDHASVNDANRQPSPLQKDYPDNCALMKRSSMTAKDTNLKNVPSCSNVSITSATRKRKAPQPPVSALPAIESPSSPDAPPLDMPTNSSQTVSSERQKNNELVKETSSKPQKSKEFIKEISSKPPKSKEFVKETSSKPQRNKESSKETSSKPLTEKTVEKSEDIRSKEAVQQESEALQYLEDVLQESEKSVKNYSNHKIMDDSDTDSQKDEGEVISVCQAEIHANANDQDSSDSVVEPHTVVTPDPVSPKPIFAPLSNPNSQSAGCEVVDTSADDSGISQSLNSDADSSVPSINSDFKTMSDSGCHEEIYCNITGGVISSSFSTPVISSGRPTPGVNTNHTVPIPLPRLSLKRKAVTSVESLNLGIWPSCDSADSKSVPSKAEHLVQSLGETNMPAAKTDEINIPDGALCDTIDHTSNVDDKSCEERSAENQLTVEDEPVSPIMDDVKSHNLEIHSETSSLECTRVQQEQNVLELNNDNTSSDKSVTSSFSAESPHNSITTTPITRKKLDNFALGCYKTDDNTDIYSIPSIDSSVENREKNKDSSSQFEEKKEIEAPVRKHRNQPDVKIVSFKERSDAKTSNPTLVQSSRNKVLEKCAQLSSISTLPLTGRSSSLYNLTPMKTIQKTVTAEIQEEESKSDCMKRTQSDQNFAKDLEAAELKTTFLQEQKRLQEEYHRLQAQFISWQKQLLCNQNLLQNENIVPQMPFPRFEDLETVSKKVVSENQMPQKDTNPSFDELKTRSLPRPKTKPLSLKEPTRPNTPPIPQTPTEASIVDIDISSQETAKRPESLTSCSVNTQVNVDLEDKVIQVPSPQDKIIQVPSPQEKVTSGTQVPSPESANNNGDISAQSDQHAPSSVDEIKNSVQSPENDSSKSQTLPRPKPKPISAFQPTQTMTLNRNARPKSQVVSVTIGSWQQRQPSISDIEPSCVASSRSKFQSLENIPQTSSRPTSIIMEKRKLPPVPTELKSSRRETVNKTTELVTENTTQVKSIHESTNTRTKAEESYSTEPRTAGSSDAKSQKIDSNITNSKVQRLVPKQEGSLQKQKMEIKLGAKEPAALFKPAKPFVKLSSMKDETHTPSIIGLKKWPLSDISENSEGRQSILEDLRVSSKKPSGFVQDKIRRAEVDLRKPRSSKAESVASPKEKDASSASSKLHITKVNINNSKESGDFVPPPKSRDHTDVKRPVTDSGSTKWNNTIPKSHSLNSELMAVFSKKASKDSFSEKSKPRNPPRLASTTSHITVNGSVQPPVPPPPPPPQPSNSAMPTIPPAEQIPVSSQLLMARGTKTLPVTKKESKKSPTKFSRTADPREELMLEIRGFGGKQALRKLYEKSCLNLLKKSPKKKVSAKEPSSSSQHK